MFKIFKKRRSGDIIDLTLLEKKGLLKDEALLQPSSDEGNQMSDIQTSTSSLPSSSLDNPQLSTTSNSPDMGFFSAMASSAQPTPILEDSGTQTDQNLDEYQNKDRVNNNTIDYNAPIVCTHTYTRGSKFTGGNAAGCNLRRQS